MDPKTGSREYEVFEPTTNWAREDKFDTFLIHLPGFKKEHLRVQISSVGNLRVMGERQVSGNKWTRFRIEMPISSNYDSNNVSAKFDNNILHVKFPKIIVKAGGAKPAVQLAKPPEPTPPAEPQKTGQKQDTKEPPKAEKVAEPQKTDQKQDTKEPPKAEKALAKQTEEEQKSKKSTEDEGKPKQVKEESKKADEAKKGPEMALQQKKSEDLAEKKATEKDQKRGDAADIGKKMEKARTSDAGDIGKPRPENYKENVGSFVTNLKKLRNLMNTMVAALLIVVLGLYVKHAFRSLGTTKPDPEL